MTDILYNYMVNFYKKRILFVKFRREFDNT